MDIILIVLAGILLFTGLAGSILPIIPGTPLSYVGILLLHFTEKHQFSTEFLVFWAVVVVVIQVLDYYIPVWGTKKFGGSKQGVRGSIIGLIFGLFLGPFGIVFGPFVGALIGELIAQKSSQQAIKAAFGAFFGFVVGSVSKLMVGGILIYYYVEKLMG